MPRTESKGGKPIPDREQIFRYWVEVLDLKNRSVRKLPLSAVAKIHIPRRKNEPQRATEEILQLKDDVDALEAKGLDDLAAQLREKYPDDKYERTLHMERDHQAEKRRTDALNRLIDLIVESFVESLSPDDATVLSAWFGTQEGKKALHESWAKMVDANFRALCNPKRSTASRSHTPRFRID